MCVYCCVAFVCVFVLLVLCCDMYVCAFFYACECLCVVSGVVVVFLVCAFYENTTWFNVMCVAFPFFVMFAFSVFEVLYLCVWLVVLSFFLFRESWCINVVRGVIRCVFSSFVSCV